MERAMLPHLQAILHLEIIAFIILSILLCMTPANMADAAPCDFFKIFNSSDRYKHKPEPFWHSSEDPLQPEPHRITKWVIHSDAIFVSHGWNIKNFREVSSYKLYCVENVSENPERVLMRLDNTGESGRFVCMELTMRSALIFQVKLSGAATSETPPRELCLQDSLVDTGMTFVTFLEALTRYQDYMRGLMQYVTCPINGGYAITSWQDETGSTKCSDPRAGNLRVEDECEMGVGIEFSDGATPDCKSPVFGEIYQRDTLRCFSKWSDDEYDYAIALTNVPSSAYCIRAPKKKDVQMQVYIFKDGICDHTSDIRYSKKFLKMELLLHKIPTVCSDVSPWCDSNNLDTGIQKSLCPETASVCQSTSVFWKDLKVPSTLQGDWYRETEALGPGHMKITDQTISFTHLGTWRFAGEANCSLHTHDLQEKGTFYLVVSMTDNGCRKRVALLWLLPFSDSALGMQLSRSVTIQTVVDDNFGLTPELLCSNTGLYFGGVEILGDHYHVSAYGWYNFVNTDKSLPIAECDVTKRNKMQVKLQEGQSCSVSLKQEGPTGFSVTVESCNQPVDGLVLNKPIKHDCLAQYKGLYDWSSFLLTRTPEDQTNLAKREYICWLFPDMDPRGYIMPIGDCDDRTDAEITDTKYKTPLVRLSLTSPTTGRAGLLVPSMLLTVSLIIVSRVLN